MSVFAVILLQIGELLKGNFNWPGAYHLFLFLLIGELLVGLSIFLGCKAFKSKNR